MKKIIYILTIFLALLITSCTLPPMTKECYLDRFQLFIAEVADNHHQFTNVEWIKKTEQFERFTGERFEKFEHELTIQERVRIVGFQAQFHFYRNLSRASSIREDFRRLR